MEWNGCCFAGNSLVAQRTRRWSNASKVSAPRDQDSVHLSETGDHAGRSVTHPLNARLPRAGWGLGPSPEEHRLRLGGPLASTSVRTNSGGRKARAFCGGRVVLIRCWADQEYLGVNARGATVAVTRHGCRRGEVFEGSMRAQEGYFGGLVRQGTPERSRTPGSGAGCNRPAGSVVEKAAVAERNREGGTRRARLVPARRTSSVTRAGSGHRAVERWRGDS